MEYRSIKGFNGWSQLGILLAFVGAGLVLAVIIQGLIFVAGMGVPMQKLETGVTKALALPANANWARLSQVLGSFVLLALPCLLYARICHGKSTFWLGFNKHLNMAQIVLGFLIIMATNLMAKPLEQLSKALLEHFPAIYARAVAAETAYADQVRNVSHLTGIGELLVAMAVLAFLPAVFEEVFFRGVLQNLLVRWWKRPFLAILTISLVFSLIHSSYFLFFSRALLGFALGWMFYQSRNIWVNIIAHFLNNALALVLLYWSSRATGIVDLKDADPEPPLWLSLVATGLSVLLVYSFYKRSEKPRTAIALQEAALVAASQPYYDSKPSNNNTFA